MSIFKRFPQNPILKPNPENSWESFATFNGCVIKNHDVYYMLYRAMSQTQTIENKQLSLSTIGIAESENGVDFSNRSVFITPEYPWEKFGCEDPRITKIEDTFFIFYTAVSAYPPNRETIKVAVAVSSDLKTISAKHLVTPFNAKGMTMFSEKIDGKFTVILTINTDKPPAKIAYAQFENIETLWDEHFWASWYENVDNFVIPLRRVSSDQVEVGAPPIKTPHGWMLLYSYIENYFTDNKNFNIEAALIDLHIPNKIIGRIDGSCLSPEESYEKEGQIKNVTFPEGAIIDGNEIKLYYGAADSYCCGASVNYEKFMSLFEMHSPIVPTFRRFDNNPLLQPNPKHPWEELAVFNPGVIDIEGKVYILYRAMSVDNVSSIGCAISYDGMYIDERLDEPIYVPRGKYERSKNKALGSGCEDPRITRIGDTLYMCYTAYDGVLPRLAMSSISVKHFLDRRWSKWTKPKIISKEGITDKDGCLFPEKINGKYAFFHRIEPNINVDYVDDLEFVNKKYLEADTIIAAGHSVWDSLKIGINAPPIKCSSGWLLFYHGISSVDHHYRLGAMLLDLADPSKVLARTAYPVLEPEMYYETEGVVNNVVFPCGLVLKNDEIFIYYGGADKVVGGAKMNLDAILDYLLKNQT